MGAILASTFWVCSWGNRGSAWPYFRGGEGISWNQTQQQREPCSVWPCAWQPGLPPGPGGDAAPLQGPVGPHLALAGGGVAPFPGGNISGLGPGLGGVQELQNSQQNPGPEPPVWGTGAKVAGLVQPVPVLSMTRSHGGARGRRGGGGDPGTFVRETGKAGLLGQARAARSRGASHHHCPALRWLCSQPLPTRPLPPSEVHLQHGARWAHET